MPSRPDLPLTCAQRPSMSAPRLRACRRPGSSPHDRCRTPRRSAAAAIARSRPTTPTPGPRAGPARISSRLGGSERLRRHMGPRTLPRTTSNSRSLALRVSGPLALRCRLWKERTCAASAAYHRCVHVLVRPPPGRCPAAGATRSGRSRAREDEITPSQPAGISGSPGTSKSR